MKFMSEFKGKEEYRKMYEEYLRKEGRKDKDKGKAKTVKKERGRPRIHDETGLPDNQQRFAFIAEKKQIQKIKAIAIKKEITIREAFAEALKDYIKKNP